MDSAESQVFLNLGNGLERWKFPSEGIPYTDNTEKSTVLVFFKYKKRFNMPGFEILY
jgi:hypothetical protein